MKPSYLVALLTAAWAAFAVAVGWYALDGLSSTEALSRSIALGVVEFIAVPLVLPWRVQRDG
jgi:hypothetical protein